MKNFFENVLNMVLVGMVLLADFSYVLSIITGILPDLTVGVLIIPVLYINMLMVYLTYVRLFKGE